MASLLERWLAHYDPIHRGWTPAGIANGVCATCGYFFPRIRGGYNLRRRREGQAAWAPAGAAGADAATVRTFPWVSHAAGAGYVYRLTAIGGGGVENLLEVAEARVAFDAEGVWPGPRPNAPRGLRVAAARGGRFLLKWEYDPAGEQAAPAAMRVYRGSGWQGVDYGAPVATVAHRPGRSSGSFLTEVFADGARVSWAVRAVSAAGVEEDNDVVVTGWADAAAPPANPTVVVRLVGGEQGA